MVLYNASKSSRRAASIVNFKQVGVKQGLAPITNITASTRRSYNSAPIPAMNMTGQTLALWNANPAKYIQRNPVGSGGVGRRFITNMTCCMRLQ